MSAPAETFRPTAKRGAELLREVLAAIEADIAFEQMGRVFGDEDHGGRWDQRWWGEVPLSDAVLAAAEQRASWSVIPAGVAYEACGTTACVAGHACLLVGDSPMVEVSFRRGRRVLWDQVQPVDGPRVGGIVSVRDRAQELLQLTETETDDLFAAENTIDDVRAIIEQILETRGLA